MSNLYHVSLLKDVASGPYETLTYKKVYAFGHRDAISTFLKTNTYSNGQVITCINNTDTWFMTIPQNCHAHSYLCEDGMNAVIDTEFQDRIMNYT